MRSADGKVDSIEVSNPSFGMTQDQVGENEGFELEKLNDYETPLDQDGFIDVEEMNKGDGWWKSLSGAKLRNKEVNDFARKYFFKDDVKKQNRFLDKMTFVLAVCAIVFLAAAMANPWGRAFIPYFFLVSTPVLLLIRYVTYKRQKAHYFLCDWCYIVNLTCCLWLTAFPANSVFFTVLFAIVSSTLPWTIIVYRNSLVFHSIDKLTSFYIHMVPPAVWYAIRWYPADCSRLWYEDFQVDITEEMQDLTGASDPSFLYLAISLPLIVTSIYFVQQSLEIIIINVVAKHSCARNWLHVYYDEEYVTLFRYSANTGKGLIYNLINLCGPKYRLTMWLIINVFYTFVTAIPVYAWYEYQLANAIFLCFAFVIGCLNGANFYIYVFSRKYKDRRGTLARPAKE